VQGQIKSTIGSWQLPKVVSASGREALQNVKIIDLFGLLDKCLRPQAGKAEALFMQVITKELYKARPMTSAYAVAWMWHCRPERFGLLPCQPGTKRLVMGFGPVRGMIESAAEVEFWFKDRGANLAVVSPSKVVILDFDKIELYNQFAAGWPELAGSYSEATPRGGRHVFLSLREGAGLVVPGLIRGIEIKKFCLVYPSQINGSPYEVLEPGPIREFPTETIRKAIEPFFVPGDKCPSLPVAPGLNRPVAFGEGRIGLPGNRGIMARVKKNWTIEQYLLYFEPRLRLEGRGEWRACLCPWHDDHTPSMRINIVSNTWRCFACGAFGDVINWHARKLAITDQLLAARDLDKYRVKVGM
jgi:hypothetical protein